MKLLNRYHIPISLISGLLFVITVLTVSGCAGGSNARLPDPAGLSDGTAAGQEGLAEGRAVYLAECATCHNRIWPDERTPEQWREILGRHVDRLPVSADSYGNVADYILRASKQPTGR